MSVEVKGLSVNINAPQGISASIKQFKKLDVNVGAVTITTPGYIPPTYEGETEVTPDKSTQTLNTDGYFVKDDITIHPIPDEYIVPEGTKNIVTNGEHDVKDFEKVDVDVPIPDGYVKLPQLSNEGTSADMLSGKELIDSEGKVVVGTIPSKTSSDLTASGATVTVPAGHYASQTSKSVATATQATPGITVSSGGLITAKATQSAGYVSSGTKQATKQLTTQAAKTVTPTKSSQTAVASGRYTTGAVTVAPIPDQYIVPSGEKEITEKGKYDVTEYASVNVDIDGEIPEGYYDASGIDTEPSKVLSGEEFINESGKQVGSMPNKGAVNATIQGLVGGMSTPQPYTIPEGYHNGQGKVQISSDVKTLHDDIAQALKQKGQTVSLDYDPKQFPALIGGIQTSEDLDSVLTEQEELIAELQETLMGKAAGGGGIPEGYYDASGITTPTSDVRKGKEFINKDGKQVGTMPEYLNGAADRTLSVDYYPDSPDSLFYVIPKGYHDGNSYVDIDPRSKSVTPTKQAQKVTPDSKTVLYEVNVAPIPDEYIVPDWEYKQVTPTKEFQHVVPSEGKVLDAVGVDPIPDEYIIPQGSKELTVNYDLYDVREFEVVYVNVPIPDGYLKPSGEKEITENGQYDVSSFASVNVNVAGGGGGGNFDGIPDGWARAGYIYFSGEQTVDTNIICNKNTKIQLAFTRERSSQHYLYGVASSDNTASVTAYLGGSWRFGNKSITKSVTTNADMIYSATITASTITVTGSASTISGTSTFETVGSLLLGACRNSDGTVGASQFIGKVLFFSMWEGTEQVLHLTPVTDGTTYRFYDTVSKTFFDSITDTPLEGGYL
jgi:hypothetical protein